MEDNRVRIGTLGYGLSFGAIPPLDTYGTWVNAQVELPGVVVNQAVFLYDPSIVLDYFGGLARDWRGWEGIRDWGAYDGGLLIASQHDGVGRITMKVTLGELVPPEHWAAPEWSITVAFLVEPGALDGFVRGLTRLLSTPQ